MGLVHNVHKCRPRVLWRRLCGNPGHSEGGNGKGSLTAAEFQQTVALAGMAPGSIATNAATLIGYQSAGYIGAAVSTAGIILPSLVVIVAIRPLLPHAEQSMGPIFLYGLRPVTTGLIVYALFTLGIPMREGLLQGLIPTPPFAEPVYFSC